MITLQHINRRDVWQLHLNPVEVVLVEPSGEVAARINASNGAGRVQFPSAFGNKNLGIRTDDGNVRWFLRDGPALAQIRSHLDALLPGRGPSAQAAQRMRACACIVGGLLIAMAAIIATVLSISAQGNVISLFIGPALGGIGLGSYGILLLNRGPRLGATSVTADPPMDWAPQAPPETSPSE
jgi:hypothetical protein